jgi:hypothetical protein
MAFSDEHRAKFQNLKVALDIQNRSRLKLTANGGNSIIFPYPPNEEDLYLKKAKEEFNSSAYQFINASELFVDYINEDGLNDFLQLYEDLSPSSYKSFFDKEDPHVDLFDKVINGIVDSSESDKIPILIRTGIFYGTGIENINITDHKKIMGMKHPLVIFYPGEMDGENHHFLNAKQASKYRCTVIE